MYDKITIKLIRLYLFFVCLIKHTYDKYTKERLYYIIYTLLSVNNAVSVPFEVCKIAGVHPFCTGVIRIYVTPLLVYSISTKYHIEITNESYAMYT